jgi:CRISPR-associated endonuclease/helicase Cas3
MISIAHIKNNRAENPIPVLSYKQCIAKTVNNKPGMSVEEHCCITGIVCRLFIKMVFPYIQNHIPEWKKIPALAAMHDLGKVSPGFFYRIIKHVPQMSSLLGKMNPDNFEWIHSVISQASYDSYFHDKVGAKILAVHHGYGDTVAWPDAYGAYGGVAWAEQRRLLIEALIEIFGQPIHPQDNIWKDVIAGLVSISDWLSSSEYNFSQEGGLSIKEIKKHAYTAIKNLGYKKSVIKPDLTFKDLFGFRVNSMQSMIDKLVTGPGVYLIEDAMGRGKTEAALYASYKLISQGHHSGLYFALPTRITSNKIHERVEKWLYKAFMSGMFPKLIHGHTFMKDLPETSVGEFSHGSPWFMSNRRALLLPYGVGTIDQALMAVLSTKFNFIRTFGLVNKVVILDEVHSYDVYTGKLLDLLIKTLRELNCTVILLSATLTHERKKELLGIDDLERNDAYPLVTAIHSTKKYQRTSYAGKPKTIKVRFQKSTMKAVKEAVKRVEAGQQVLWICNYVDKAVAVYKRLKNKLKGYDVDILHSRIMPLDRSQKEDTWTTRLGKKGDRSKGSVLVATQVVEQSLDIDADFLVTDLAPSDFMLQRIGRLHRQQRRVKPCDPEVWIMTPPLGNIHSASELRDALYPSFYIYSSFVLWRSYKVWKKYSSICIPSDMRKILEDTYRDYDEKDPKWLQEVYDRLIGDKIASKQMARANTGSHIIVGEDVNLSTGDDDNEDYTPTRIGRLPYIPLILFESYSEKNGVVNMTFIDGETCTYIIGSKVKECIEAAKKLNQRLVMVPVTKDFRDCDAPQWMDEIMSRVTLPVTVCNNTVYFNNEPTSYKMTRKTGVYKEKPLL